MTGTVRGLSREKTKGDLIYRDTVKSQEFNLLVQSSLVDDAAPRSPSSQRRKGNENLVNFNHCC